MQTRFPLVIAGALAGGIAIGAGSAPALAQDTTFVRIATAGSGGNFYRLGAGVASLWNEEIEGIQASIQATQGSPNNMDLLADGEVEVAFVSTSVAYDAYHNEGQWAERPEGRYKNAMFVTTLYPNPMWLVAMDWAEDIESLRDLEGKRVSVGMLGSQGESVWRRIMEIIGITYDDIQPEYTVHQEAIDQVRNRQVDAVAWPDGAGSPSITQILDTGFARLVDLDEDVIQAMTEHSLDFPYTVPAGSMPGQTEPIRTWASPTAILVRDDLPEDLVYEFTRTIHEMRDELIKVHPIAQYITLETALEGRVGELHPGAERYYREIDILE